MELFDYLEVFYNQRRRHSTIGLVSPAAFERAVRVAVASAGALAGIHHRTMVDDGAAAEHLSTCFDRCQSRENDSVNPSTGSDQGQPACTAVLVVSACQPTDTDRGSNAGAT